MASCSCSGCSFSCGCSCHRYTSPAAAGRAAARLGRLHDRARDMKARAGLRRWSVAIVRARSMGGRRRGDGPYEILNRWEILPIPRVSDTSTLKQILDADQLRESGSLIISEISSSYTEDMLLGRGTDGRPVAADELVFWEVSWINADGTCGKPRRFHVDGAPGYLAESAQWTVTLVRAPNDREPGTGILR